MENEPNNPTPNFPIPPVPGAAKAAAPTPPAPAAPKEPKAPKEAKAKAEDKHADLDLIFKQYTNLKEAWYDAKTGGYHFNEEAAEKAGASERIESKHYKAPKNVKK